MSQPVKLYLLQAVPGNTNYQTVKLSALGGTAGYDSTLNGKVLSLAIREAVDNLAIGVENSGLLK